MPIFHACIFILKIKLYVFIHPSTYIYTPYNLIYTLLFAIPEIIWQWWFIPQTFHHSPTFQPLLAVRQGHVISSGQWAVGPVQWKAGMHPASGTEEAVCVRWQSHKTKATWAFRGCPESPSDPQIVQESEINLCSIKPRRREGCLWLQHNLPDPHSAIFPY